MAQKYAKDQPKGSNNKIERVAIVGATGTIGKFIVEELLKTGQHTITAISRTAQAADAPKGLRTAVVDYDDESTLVEALRGQQFLIITMSTRAPRDTQHKLIKAAADAGVPWVLPNSYSHDVMDKKFGAENLCGPGIWAATDAIEKHGVSSWVSVCCGFWYEHSLTLSPSWYGFDLKNKKVTFYDDGKARINTSTWRQCARAVARLLSLKELPEDDNDKEPTLSAWRNKPLYTSSFLVSQRDMLDSMNRVLGLSDADWTIEHEAATDRYDRGREMLKQGNHLGFVLAMYVRAFYPSGEGNFEERYGLANEALALPEEDLDEATKRAIDMTDAYAQNGKYGS